MKKTLSLFLIIALLFCAALPRHGAQTGNTYNIDAENGNDENSGISESAPWKTLAFVSSKTYSAGA